MGALKLKPNICGCLCLFIVVTYHIIHFHPFSIVFWTAEISLFPLNPKKNKWTIEMASITEPVLVWSIAVINATINDHNKDFTSYKPTLNQQTHFFFWSNRPTEVFSFTCVRSEMDIEMSRMICVYFMWLIYMINFYCIDNIFDVYS